MDIQVILTQSDPKLGPKGQVVKVSKGFAQNFLFPQGKAKPASPENLKVLGEEKARLAQKTEGALAEARETAKRLSELSLTLEVRTGDNDKLYGSVTNQHIQEELAKHGVSLEKKSIHLEEPIHELGVFSVPVKIHPEVTVKLKVWVVKKK